LELFMSTARLHNFVENERQLVPVVVGVLEDDDVPELFFSSDQSQNVYGNSMMRDILVEKVYHSG
jgi:hypothetical protein